MPRPSRGGSGAGWRIELQKKPDEAVKVLQAALKEIKSPEARAEAHYLIGGSQIELKQFDAAVKSLAASLAAARQVAAGR